MEGNNGRKHELFGLCWRAMSGCDDDDESLNNLRRWFNCNKHNEEYIKEAAACKGKNNWTPLHAILQKHSKLDVVDTLIEHAPETVRMKDTDGLLPLHYACWNGASLQIIKMLLKAYPESAHMADNIGTLPLHCACYRGASLDIPRLLIDAYPKSIQVTDNFGWLPLHWACYSGASPNVLNILIKAFPESIDVEGSNRRPSDYLKEHYNNDKGKLILHDATTSGFSVYLIKLLLEAFPESCMVQDDDGKTALHRACENSTSTAIAVNSMMDVVMVLLNANPQSSMVADNRGRTPSCFLKSVATCKDENGMLPLHYQAAFSKYFTVNSLFLLFSVFPESIALPDNYGMLPFHHACLNTASPVDALMLFIKLHPESIAQKYAT